MNFRWLRLKRETEREWLLARRWLFKIKKDPYYFKSKIEEILPILEFADNRYAFTHKRKKFKPLVVLAHEILTKKK